jgi:hypothetical protein
LYPGVVRARNQAELAGAALQLGRAGRSMVMGSAWSGRDGPLA